MAGFPSFFRGRTARQPPQAFSHHRVPFSTVAKLTQPDGLHPTAEGVDVVVERILPTVEAFLKDRAVQLSKP